jgi:hypothetical protein
MMDMKIDCILLYSPFLKPSSVRLEKSVYFIIFFSLLLSGLHLSPFLTPPQLSVGRSFYLDGADFNLQSMN